MSPRPTGRKIAAARSRLALVKGGRARVGQTLHVPMASETIAVEVTGTVFFDEEGGRVNG